MNKTLRILLVGLGITVAGVANAGSLNSTSFATATGSCMAVSLVTAGTMEVNPELRRIANDMKKHFDAVKKSLKGPQSIDAHNAFGDAYKKASVATPEANKQDLVWCAQKMDAGQL